MPVPKIGLRSAGRTVATGAACVLVAAFALTTGHAADAGSGTRSTAAATAINASEASTTTPIKHLVVIFDENESFDHYFGTYPHAANTDGVTFTAAAGTPTPKNLESDGVLTDNPNSTKPFRLTPAEALTCSQKHQYNPEQQAMDWQDGAASMDRFPQSTSQDTCNGGPFQTTGLTMGYFDGNTATALWNYAQNYTMSDNNWDATFGPSTPGALEVAAGQTWGAKAYESTSNDSSPTPATPDTATGLAQVDPTTGLGTLIQDPDPVYDDCSDNNHTGTSNVVGMATGKNIGDLLNAKGITWGWFQGGFRPDVAYAGPGTYAQCTSQHANVDDHEVRDYTPHHDPFQYYKSTSNPHHLAPSSAAMIGHTDRAHHNYDLRDFTTALDDDNLPAVSYLKAAAYQDAHPGHSDPLDEQHFLVREINAIENSDAWPSTAIVITYDDSDGWYDHVAPTITNSSNTSDDAAICTDAASSGVAQLGGHVDRCGPSQRLPLLVISPFVKKNVIEHTATSQPSVLGFIEENWGLGTLGGGSFDASAGKLDSFFDFAHPQQRAVLLNSTGTVASTKPVVVPPEGGFPVTLSTTRASATYGRPTALHVTARSQGDVSGARVKATIDGRAGPSATLSSTSVTLKLPATLRAGSHTVRLSYAGSSDTSSATTTVAVKVAKASVTLRAKAGKAHHHKVRVTVRVSDAGASVRPSGTLHANGSRVHVRAGVAHVTVKVAKHKHKWVRLTFTSSNYLRATKRIKVKG